MSEAPRKTTAPRRRRRIMWGIAAAVLVLAALNLALGPVLDARTEPRDPWLIRGKWALADKPPVEADWLFVGDSACSHALDPTVWREATGQSALNLCTTEATGLVEAAWLFNTYLRRHRNPRNVVIMLSPTSWRRQSKVRLLKHVPLDWAELSELRPHPKGLDKLRWTFARHRYLPIVSRRKDWVRLLSGGNANGRTMDPLGFTPRPDPQPAEVRRSARRILGGLATKKAILSRHARRGLNRIAFLAQQNEMTLWIVSPPVAKGLAEKPKHQAFVADLRHQLEVFLQRKPNVRVQDVLPTLPRSEMVDATHAATSGASSFTRALARELGAARANVSK